MIDMYTQSLLPYVHAAGESVFVLNACCNTYDWYKNKWMWDSS